MRIPIKTSSSHHLRIPESTARAIESCYPVAALSILVALLWGTFLRVPLLSSCFALEILLLMLKV